MITKNQMLEEQLLEDVVSNDLSIAVAAASSQYATDAVLNIAALDKDKEVRLAAVNNVNISLETLQFLANDIDEEISTIAKLKLEAK